MSEKAIPQREPSEEDVNTTPPNPAVIDGKAGWRMPEPVFRKTSGYLPQGFEKRFSQDEIRTSTKDDDSTAEMAAPEIAANIEPQPNIEHNDDSIDQERPLVAAAAPRKGSSAKIIFTVLGILLILGLLAVIAAVVYFLYIMPGSDSTF